MNNLEEYVRILEPYFCGYDDDYPTLARTINLNDVFGWAIGDSEYVKEEDIPELGTLVFKYGFCGMLYWVSKKRGCKSEFHHYNRMIEFVTKEEEIKNSHQSESKYAYDKKQYTIGS